MIMAEHLCGNVGGAVGGVAAVVLLLLAAFVLRHAKQHARRPARRQPILVGTIRMLSDSSTIRQIVCDPMKMSVRNVLHALSISP